MLNVANRMIRGYPLPMSSDPSVDLPDELGSPDLRLALRLALKRSSSVLKGAQVPFALGGGYALWVHGAPESEHDVDLVVAQDQVEIAAETLADAGFRVERPPEDWLFKAYLDDVPGAPMVDVLHQLHGVPVDADLIGRATEHEVLGVRIPVLDAGEVITGKLLAMTERYCDFSGMLAVVRAVREQVDWPRVVDGTAGNDFAYAFLVLLRRLGIVQVELPPA
jgi:hypothetical protein